MLEINFKNELNTSSFEIQIILSKKKNLITYYNIFKSTCILCKQFLFIISQLLSIKLLKIIIVTKLKTFSKI